MTFKNLCNLITWPWPRILLTFSRRVQIGICLLSFLLCVGIYLLTSPPLHTDSILIIPMGLFSWTFRKRGACTCLAAYIVVQAIYNTLLFQGLMWSSERILSFAGAVFMLFIVGSVFVSLRELLEGAESARVKAEQGERQAALAYDQQRRLTRVKNQFLLNVNHELRTPLAALYGYVEMLQVLLEETGALDRATYSTYFKEAMHCCEDLRLIVNNVLNSMEGGSGEEVLKFESVSVIAVVGDLLIHREAFQRMACRVRCSIPPYITVWADSRCLRHVLHNLLSNAFKYTPEDTPVVVSAADDSDHADYIRICVSDTGPGIPPEQIPELFGQFVRLNRDVGGTVRGTGLGLYIAKSLVEAMDGKIWVESSGIAGEGSRFYVALPVKDRSGVLQGPSARG